MSPTVSANPKLHPVLWTAAVSVTIASLVAVAAMTGVLPNSRASAAPSVADIQPGPLANARTPGTATGHPDADKPVAKARAETALPTSSRLAAHAGTRVASAPQRAYDSEIYAAAHGLPPPTPLVQAEAAAVATVCQDCGIVESVRTVAHEGEGSGLGAVAGGVIGGALGNTVGRGNGRTLATLAGIVGGAFAGNKVEKSMHESTHYEVTVRFDDGSRRTFTETIRPPWREGERVKLSNGSLTYVG